MVTYQFIQNPVSGQVHASTFLELKNGGVIAAWFQGTREGAADVAIFGSRRIGDVWTESSILAKAVPDMPHWNPVLRRGDDGRIVLYFKVGPNCSYWRTFYTESYDEGLTWSPPSELVLGDESGGRGPVRNKCLKLPNGRWLAPASCEIGEWRSFIDRSEDDGRTWTRSAKIRIVNPGKGRGTIQPTLWLDFSGVVHAYMRSSIGYIYESISRNNGETWSTAKPTELPNNNSGIDLVKASNGTLYLAMNPVSGNWAPRSELVIMCSADNGHSWQLFETLEKEPEGEFSYPCIREISPGILAVSYTWNRRCIAFREIRCWQ